MVRNGLLGAMVAQVPELSAFLILTVVPQFGFVCYVCFGAFDRLPIEGIVGVPMVIFLVCERPFSAPSSLHVSPSLSFRHSFSLLFSLGLSFSVLLCLSLLSLPPPSNLMLSHTLADPGAVLRVQCGARHYAQADGRVLPGVPAG